MFRTTGSIFAAYALIWAIFLAAPVSRYIVLDQLRRLRGDLRVRLAPGLVLGLALVVLNVAAVVTLGTRAFGGWRAPQLGGLALTIAYTLVVASSEELILRGVMLTRIRKLTNDMVAIGLTTVIFSIMHLGRQDFSVATSLQYAADGIFLGWAATRTGSIWLGVGWHWGKNLGVALAFGLSRHFMDPLLALAPTSVRAGHWADLIAYAVTLPLAVVAVLALSARRGSTPAGHDDEPASAPVPR
jgi:membrane protease YdiL (CAAX protease family)